MYTSFMLKTENLTYGINLICSNICTIFSSDVCQTLYVCHFLPVNCSILERSHVFKQPAIFHHIHNSGSHSHPSKLQLHQPTATTPTHYQKSCPKLFRRICNNDVNVQIESFLLHHITLFKMKIFLIQQLSVDEKQLKTISGNKLCKYSDIQINVDFGINF